MLRRLPTFLEAGAAGRFPIGFRDVVRQTYGHRTPLLCELLQHDVLQGGGGKRAGSAGTQFFCLGSAWHWQGSSCTPPGDPSSQQQVPGCFLQCRAEAQEMALPFCFLEGGVLFLLRGSELPSPPPSASSNA